MNYPDWKRGAKAYIKGTLRRQRDLLLPDGEVRAYQHWIRRRQTERAAKYKRAPEPGLLSILTPVWNGSPLRYLRELADSIGAQNQDGACEWLVLDNGCSEPRLVEYLRALAELPGARVLRAETNLGITPGLRRCLEHANGRYVLPVDADDWLYPDALRVVASAIAQADYPALLYTDEDKAIGGRRYQPYFKPDWDPVLLLNSAYIAHLGVIDREKALALGGYSDARTEGSPDWDLFVRFLMAGERATHIPEIVYSWRVHAASTADDAATKPYIASSQQRVLEKYLAGHAKGELFEVVESPLLPGGGHWRLRRREMEPRPACAVMRIGRDDAQRSAQQCLDLARGLSEADGWLWTVAADLLIDGAEWQWEAAGIAELHPDVVMIGGRVRDTQNRIVEAGMEFGLRDVYGSPNAGRTVDDPGYFGQMWKQRSVGAVGSQFAAIRARFLIELLEQIPEDASLALLGAWAGAYAKERGQRIVYSPFLSAVTDENWPTKASKTEKARFRERYGDLRDGRTYPGVFSRTDPFRLS